MHGWATSFFNNETAFVCAEAGPHHPELGAASIPDAEYFRN
jgi:hypothetical protein